MAKRAQTPGRTDTQSSTETGAPILEKRPHKKTAEIEPIEPTEIQLSAADAEDRVGEVMMAIKMAGALDGRHLFMLDTPEAKAMVERGQGGPRETAFLAPDALEDALKRHFANDREARVLSVHHHSFPQNRIGNGWEEGNLSRFLAGPEVRTILNEGVKNTWVFKTKED